MRRALRIEKRYAIPVESRIQHAARRQLHRAERVALQRVVGLLSTRDDERAAAQRSTCGSAVGRHVQTQPRDYAFS